MALCMPFTVRTQHCCTKAPMHTTRLLRVFYMLERLHLFTQVLHVRF